MSDLVANALDSYERRARLYPMIVVLMPVTLGIFSWIPSSADSGALAGSAVIGIGAAAFLSQLARDQGKKKEPDLFKLWGGMPSIHALSYRGAIFDRTTLLRYHQSLKRLDPNLQFPQDEDAESEEPDRALEVYTSANELLLSRTRERDKFRLVFEENVSYGYRRNLWAMKKTGIATATLGLVGGISRVLTDVATGDSLSTTASLCTLISVMLLVIWLMRVKPMWIRVAADSFAKQLVSASEVLETKE